MKKNFSTTFSAFMLSIILSFPAQSQTFQKAYDLGSDDYVNMSIIDSATGEIVSVGSSSYAGAGGYDAILTKVDASGNFVWEKQYGGAGTEFGTAVAATTSGSGYAIAGRSNSFTTGGALDIALIKTDNNGDLLWAKTYGTDSAEYAIYVLGTFDNGYAITGQTQSLGNGGLDAFLLKTDSSGNVQWFKTYGSSANESGSQIIQTPDSGFAVIGNSGSGGAGFNDIYFVKTDKLGNIEGQLLIGGAGDDIAKRILQLNSNAIITGTTRATGSNSQDDIFIVELNLDSLTVVWAKTYGSSVNNDAPTAIALFPGGGYALSGNTQSFSSFFNGLLFLVDPAGVFQGGLVYGGTSDVFAQDLQIVNNNVLLTGFASGFGTASDLYLIQFPGDPAGTCLRQDVVLTETPTTMTVVGPVIATHVATSITDPAVTANFTQSSATASETDACANLPLEAHAGNDGSICSGGQLQIGGSPVASGGTGPYTYSWSPATGLNNPGDGNPIASPTAPTIYTLTVTDSLGATATDEVTVTIDSLPVAAINPPGPNICQGQNVTLTASGGNSYSWSTGTTTAVIVEFPTAASTDYTVTVTGNCGTATATETVTSHTRPTVTVTPANPTICDTASTGITLQASGAETYQWTPSAGLSSDTSSNPVALPDTTTAYTVTGKNGHCAGNSPTTVTVTVDVCIGIKDMPQTITNIFPNPASNMVNITFDSKSSSDGVLSILAVDGRTEFESIIVINYGVNNLSINTEGLAPGLHFVKIKTLEVTAIAKIIIE